VLWDKKGGWQWQVVLGLILLILAGGILIYFVAGPYYDWMLSSFGDAGERQICKKSVELNAKRIGVMGYQFDPFIDVKCKILPLEIEEKDPEKIKKLLADRLYWTWIDFGEGKKEIFEHTGGTFCRPRYSPISFKNNVKVDNFIQYLAENNPDGKDVSYLEFITGSKLEGDLSKLGNIKDSIDPNREYSLVFMINKKGFWQKWVLSSLEFVGGGFWGYVAGSAIALIPGVGTVPGVTIIASLTAAGGIAGGARGYILGISYEDFTTSLALVPLNEVPLLECES